MEFSEPRGLQVIFNKKLLSEEFLKAFKRKNKFKFFHYLSDTIFS